MKRVVVVFALLAIGLAVLIGAKLREQQASAHRASGGSGVIEGTEVRIASKIAARVVKIAVAEGQRVEAGALLVELDCAEPRAQLAEAEARLRAATAQAQAATAVVAQARHGHGAARRAAEATKAQASALAAQRDAAMRQSERLAAMGQDVPIAQLDQTKAGAEGLTHQLEGVKAQSEATTEQASAAETQIKVAEANAQAALRGAEAAEAAVARVRLAAAECTLTAPRAAVVEVIALREGELATPAAPIVRLVDLRQVKAAFYLPNAELAAAKPGQTAEVEADAYPGQRFAGRVSTVASEAEFTPRNIQTRSDRDRLVYRVEVAVDNPEEKLRPGMPVQVTLPGTER